MLCAVRSTKTRAAVRCAAGFWFCLVARSADAAGPLGAQGASIQTSDYTLDLFQGPVLASARVTAMGGAYSALAEGAEGIPFNVAAASQRDPYSTKRIDYDLTAGITFPSSIASTDFENNGRNFGYENFIWATVGGRLQVDHWGFGTSISVQNYSIGAPSNLAFDVSGVKALAVRIFKVDPVVSYGFFNDQLHVGGGVRSAVFTALDTSSQIDKLLLGTYGLGAQAGVLWRPLTWPLRVGGTIRSPVIKSLESAPHLIEDPATGDRHVGRFYLPRGVNLPWELEWGTAFQIGPRPLNLPWTDERTLQEPRGDAHRTLRARYRALPRQKLLLSFATLITGPTHGAVSVTSLLTQMVDRSGEMTSVTIRGGAEAEIVPNRLQVRLGSYMEPTRFRESSPRIHGTTGFEVRVLDWSVFGLFPEDNSFRISGAVDGARGYFGWSLSVGSWY
jgi:hypothetical protein